MAYSLATSVQTEGSNPLKDFFDSNDKLDIEWYNVLREDGIDYDDLIECDKKGLRDILTATLQNCAKKEIAINRIMNVVKKIPESTIYKDSNATKVSVISSDENEAVCNIKKESARIHQFIQNITATMETLNTNSTVSETTINDHCDVLLKHVHKRRDELLTKLKNITDNKHNKLSNQENILLTKVKQLNEFYDKAQDMIKDTTMDGDKRKTKILSESKQILNDTIENELKLVTNDKINVKMDINEVMDILSNIGDVIDGNHALPPSVAVKKIKCNSAVIIIKTNEEEKKCVAHKVEYVESNDGAWNMDDEKLEWMTQSIQISLHNDNKSVEYELKGLNKCSTYMLRVASQNDNGLGLFSKCITFKTKDVDPKQLVLKQMIFDRSICPPQYEIVNDFEVKAVGKHPHKNAIRFKYAMPTQTNNIYKHSFISWTVTLINGQKWGGNYLYLIGVVSNKTKDFTKGVCCGLNDAYGISGLSGRVAFGDPNSYKSDSVYTPPQEGVPITIKYDIENSRLLFYQGTNTERAFYTMILPNDVTHWYPCVCLRVINERLVISNINII